MRKLLSFGRLGLRRFFFDARCLRIHVHCRRSCTHCLSIGVNACSLMIKRTPTGSRLVKCDASACMHTCMQSMQHACIIMPPSTYAYEGDEADGVHNMESQIPDIEGVRQSEAGRKASQSRQCTHCAPSPPVHALAAWKPQRKCMWRQLGQHACTVNCYGLHAP